MTDRNTALTTGVVTLLMALAAGVMKDHAKVAILGAFHPG
jgi:hypothetical protein